MIPVYQKFFESLWLCEHYVTSVDSDQTVWLIWIYKVLKYDVGFTEAYVMDKPLSSMEKQENQFHNMCGMKKS